MQGVAAYRKTSQVTVTTSPTLLVYMASTGQNNIGRTSIKITNNSTSLVVYLGNVTVKSTTGYVLKSGSSITYYRYLGDDTNAALYGISNSTVVVTVDEEWV